MSRKLNSFLGLIALAASCGSALAGGRTVDVSDQLSVKVVNQSELDVSATVAPDGTIPFAYIGRVKVAGRTEDAIAAAIRKALVSHKVSVDPQVVVSTVGYGAQVSVQGVVGAPGNFPMDRVTTLAQALSRAGGVRDGAGAVVVKKANGSVARYDAKELLSGKIGDRSVHDSDRIYVEQAPTFFVYGFVNRAGEYPMIHPLTVQEAIAIGGGMGPLGSEWRLSIKREQDGKVVEIPAHLEDKILPHDVIVVAERIF
jgi:polysaccharide export outer membrane protein